MAALLAFAQEDLVEEHTAAIDEDKNERVAVQETLEVEDLLLVKPLVLLALRVIGARLLFEQLLALDADGIVPAEGVLFVE